MLSKYIVLRNQQIHLWFIPLNISTQLENLYYMLSTEEREKAYNFYFELHKNKYIVRRAALRQILSKYCKVRPINIDFKYNHCGKPYLRRNRFNLQFNMSHSQDMAILAIAKKHSIGADIECIKPVNDLTTIVKKFFSIRENFDYLLIPEHHKTKAFYSVWTRKEAFTKAIGKGLLYPFKAFDVTSLPNDAAKILSIKNSTIEASRWVLYEFIFNYLNNLYVANIAIKSAGKK